ncbi:dihydrofolate reductase [Marinicrinis lubricantis]|uniref:Dihydrofolate reductase n=1 Tax=Marinicrinis lubricantis TaxID=2086470 RepID=A0ABW1ILG2_9BACL
MISLIWAMGENREIGKDHDMPWKLPAELAYFKKTTMGSPVLMGRKTFESIGKPLPGRENWVLTRDRGYTAIGCRMVYTLEEAVEQLKDVQEIFVIGGAEIYRMFLPYADRLYVTKIKQSFPADTFFPEINWSQWRQISAAPGEKNERNPYDYEFQVYERIK